MIIATDLDGTLTTGQMGRAVGRYLSDIRPTKGYRRFFWRQFPRYVSARLGLLDMRKFKTGWALAMPVLFKGFTVEEMEKMFAYVVEHELWPNRRQDIVAELQQKKAEGYEIVIVSGAYQPMLAHFAKRLGAAALGTPLEMVDGTATGRIVEPLNVGPSKVQQLETFLNGRPLALAYGDSVDDLPMLELAETPVAAYPDAKLQHIAQEKGWRIIGT